jgi:outer membrane protein TolC
MSTYRGVSVLLLSLACQALLAQSRQLTIEQSVQLGLENSKTFHASLMRSELAEAKASEMKAALFPSLKVQASYQHLSEVPEFKIPFPGIPTIFPYLPHAYVARAVVQQPLFTGWRLLGAADNASYQAEASRRDVAKDRAELILGIKTAYWTVFRTGEVRRLAEENVKQIESHLRDSENLARLGMATQNDVLKVRVQLANSRLLLSDAANNLRVATIALNSTIGLSLETEIAIASPLSPPLRESAKVNDLVNKALSVRPDLLGLQLRLKAADAAVTSATGGWFPQVFLTGSYTTARPNQRIIPMVDEFRDTWDIGVSLQFDIWNNLSTLHQTTQAKAQREQVRDALGSMHDGIVLEVTQSVLNCQQARERIELAELTVQQANENYKMAAERFKTGLITSSDLLDAELMLLQAKLQLTNAQVEYELSQAKLEKVAGLSSEEL